ncbi:MAG: methyltransferase domain-containing protein, partial [Anaerolineae bacterium]
MGEEENPRAEEMASFFDVRADGYDAHMEETVASFEEFYRAVASPIARTEAPIRVLDLGCGTGLEIAAILERAPNARIVGIDLSKRMLDKLRERYAARMDQITLREASYLDLPAYEEGYDYVLAVMTLHHLLPEAKRALYEQIYEVLLPGGAYIEGDYAVTPEKEEMLLRRYEVKAAEVGGAAEGSHHIDIPFSLETQRRLLAEAGFGEMEVIWQEGEATVYVAREPPPQPSRPEGHLRPIGGGSKNLPQPPGTEEGGALPPEMMARYGGEMRRRAGERELGQREGIGRGLLVAAALVGLVLAWQLVAYSLKLGTYIRLTAWGAEAQGTVLRMRTVPPVPKGEPSRRIVTYGFWAGQQGIIQQQDVGRETYLALYVDGPVVVVYAPRHPETSRIVQELASPSPWAVIVLLAVAAGLGYGGAWAVGWAEIKRMTHWAWKRRKRPHPASRPDGHLRPDGGGEEATPSGASATHPG